MSNLAFGYILLFLLGGSFLYPLEWISKRDFVLSVPRATRTAREANAWTYGLSSDQYQLEVRT